MRHLQLTEGAPTRLELVGPTPRPRRWTPLELAVVIADAHGSGWWEVAAGRKVGVARVGDLQVTVSPKVADRPARLHDGLRPEARRSGATTRCCSTRELDLPDALAESFARLASKALEQGLLHGYRTVDDTLPVLRGRIREATRSAAARARIPLEVRTTSSPSTSPRTNCCSPPPSGCCGCRACPRPVRRALQQAAAAARRCVTAWCAAAQLPPGSPRA